MILPLALAWLPPPPPAKQMVDQATRCDMFAPDGTRTSLTIKLRYERSYNSDGFWWTITGDPVRYPSNPTARRMYNYESNATWDTMSLGFEGEGGWHYSYTLYFSAVGEGDHSHLVPGGFLVVVRNKERPDGLGFDEGQRVGIGFCTALPTDTKQ